MVVKVNSPAAKKCGVFHPHEMIWVAMVMHAGKGVASAWAQPPCPAAR